MPFLVGIPVVTLLLTGFSPQAGAVSFDQQMNQLKTANTQVLQPKQQLSDQALDLSKNVAQLETKSAKLDDQISQTAQKVADIKQTIAQTQKDLTQQRGEIVANVSKSENQSKVNATISRIDELSAQLTDAKQSIGNMQTDKKATQANLRDARTKSQILLGLNQDRQDVFEASIKANIDKINQSQSDQTAKKDTQNTQAPETPVPPVAPAPAPAPDPAAVAAASPSYPWADVPFPSDGVDPWGMFYRQCVSYTAWKVAHSGRHMPNWGGYGNANQWDDNAIAQGIPVDTNPRVGDVAVQNGGTFGHVMYVEAVNPDGTIYISQMNYDLQGNYSEMTRSAAGLVFVHFP